MSFPLFDWVLYLHPSHSLFTFFLPRSFVPLSALRNECLETRGIYDEGTKLAGHLYTQALDAAKQGLRFKFGHLRGAQLEEALELARPELEQDPRSEPESVSSDDEGDQDFNDEEFIAVMQSKVKLAPKSPAGRCLAAAFPARHAQNGLQMHSGESASIHMAFLIIIFAPFLLR